MSLKAQRKADRLANQAIARALKNGPLTATSGAAALKGAQRLLKIAGFAGPGAVEKFDASVGAAADGLFDASTFEKLKTVQARVRNHAGDTFLGRGQAGDEVARVERRLQRLGYDVGAADGVFDAQTAKAVQAFKRDEGIDGDSQFIGERSSTALAAEVKATAQAPYRGRVTKNLAEHRRLDAATAAAAQAGIGASSSKRVVANVQAHLKAAGFDPGVRDGVFDGRTLQALQSYQRAAKLPVTEQVDGKSWGALKKAMFEAKSATSPAQKLGENSAAVRASEKILERLGFKGVKVDGIFDRATQKASRKFEKKYRGLGDDGQIGAGQLRRMKQVLHAKFHPGHGPELKKGTSGHPVTQLERRLKALGFNPGKIDGKFSDATKRAVKRFQRAFALNADGVVGKGTWKKLGIVGKGRVKVPGLHGTAAMKRLAANSRAVAMGMGGFHSQGLCATGVSRAISRTLGIFVGGNGNQIDDNLPRSRFQQVHISLAQALKTPGLILTWEHTSTTLGAKFGHTAITWGDGHTSSSDFIETNTLGGSTGRTGLKIFRMI